MKWGFPVMVTDVNHKEDDKRKLKKYLISLHDAEAALLAPIDEVLHLDPALEHLLASVKATDAQTKQQGRGVRRARLGGLALDAERLERIVDEAH